MGVSDNDKCVSVTHVRSQARPRVAKVAQIAYEVANSWQLQITQEDGTIQRHKKMALLRGSFTDEEP